MEIKNNIFTRATFIYLYKCTLIIIFGKTDITFFFFLFSWSGFEDCLIELQKWLSEIYGTIDNEPQLKSTLDEKRAQLLKYRSLLSDSAQRNQDVLKLKALYDSLPQKDDDIKNKLDSVTDKYNEILKRAQVR